MEHMFTLKNTWQVLIRPIRPEDEPNHRLFIAQLAPEDLRYRFFSFVQEIPSDQMARFTHIDPTKEMAFIAVGQPDSGAPPGTLGVVRMVRTDEPHVAEFSIVVSSDLKGTGLGHALMSTLLTYCRDTGIKKIIGHVMRDNHRMFRFVAQHGFQQKPTNDIDFVDVECHLSPPPEHMTL